MWSCTASHQKFESFYLLKVLSCDWVIVKIVQSCTKSDSMVHLYTPVSPFLQHKIFFKLCLEFDINFKAKQLC